MAGLQSVLAFPVVGFVLIWAGVSSLAINVGPIVPLFNNCDVVVER